MARPAEAAANVGRNHFPFVYRSGFLFHRRLVSHLSGRERHISQERLDCHLDSLYRHGSGNFFGGWVSGQLIRRAWPVGKARKAMVVFGAIGMTLLIPTIFTTNLPALTLLFALATFCYGSYTTIANVLPSDLFFADSVASVSGLSGTAASIGTIIVFELAGHLSDSRLAAGTHLFDPLMILCGLIPFIGMILVLLLVRNTEATQQGLVRRI